MGGQRGPAERVFDYRAGVPRRSRLAVLAAMMLGAWALVYGMMWWVRDVQVPQGMRFLMLVPILLLLTLPGAGLTASVIARRRLERHSFLTGRGWMIAGLVLNGVLCLIVMVMLVTTVMVIGFR